MQARQRETETPSLMLLPVPLSRSHRNRSRAPMSKHALSGRSQVQHPITCTRPVGQCFPRSRKSKKEKRVPASWSSKAVLEVAASGAQARDASVNEPVVRAFSAASGSRSDIARTVVALNSSWDVNWQSPSAPSYAGHK